MVGRASERWEGDVAREMAAQAQFRSSRCYSTVDVIQTMFNYNTHVLSSFTYEIAQTADEPE